jgi:hypothetical protein
MKTARAARIFDRWVAEQGLTAFVAAWLANDPVRAWRSPAVVRLGRATSAKDKRAAVLATALFRGMWKRERGPGK